MALRQTTRPHTDEALQQAELLMLSARADAKNGSNAQTEEAVMDQALPDRSHSANRKLRNLIIVGNALLWLAIIAALRFILS